MCGQAEKRVMVVGAGPNISGHADILGVFLTLNFALAGMITTELCLVESRVSLSNFLFIVVFYH